MRLINRCQKLCAAAHLVGVRVRRRAPRRRRRTRRGAFPAASPFLLVRRNAPYPQVLVLRLVLAKRAAEAAEALVLSLGLAARTKGLTRLLQLAGLAGTCGVTRHRPQGTLQG